MNKKIFLKLLATVFLLTVIFYRLDFSEILEVFAFSNVFLISLCLLIIPLLYAIRVIKWDQLLISTGIKHPFSKLFIVILIGIFYGMITPGKTGEVIRAYHLNSEKSITIPTIIWDKLSDIFILILFSAFSVFLLFADSYLLQVLLILIIIFSFSIFLLINKKFVYFFLNILGINDKSKEQFMGTIHSILKDRKLLIKILGFSICYYFLALFVAVISLMALDADANLKIALIYPIIVLVGNIPITISGLGLREYVTVVCFEILKENPAVGFSFSILLFMLTTLVPGLSGYLIMLTEKKPAKI